MATHSHRAPHGIELRTLAGDDLTRALPDLARLRTTVFRAWPYLYDGDAAYEERYLATFAAAPGAVIVGAFERGPDPQGPAEGRRMVGAATACPLIHADPAFAAPFEGCDGAHDPASWFYFGESVLEPAQRGRGVGVAFLAAREAEARAQGYTRTCFCTVERAPDDPRRPADAASLDGFWRRRGYAPLGLTARYTWRDVGDAAETEKTMRFWGRTLG